MASWRDWRRRVKDLKRDHRISDATIAAAMGVERATVNSWLNKREPNLSDFMTLCEIIGADPGHILFEHPVLRDEAGLGTEAHAVMAASPTADPNHQKFVSKLRRFKQRKRRLNRPLVRS